MAASARRATSAPLRAASCCAHLLRETSPARAVPRGRRSASAPPSTAAADAASADASANASDSEDSDTDDPGSFLCDDGPLLSDAALLADARVACPFTASGVEVHCPGVLVAQRASDWHWKVAFFDGDTWFVRCDRLFTIADLAST